MELPILDQRNALYFLIKDNYKMIAKTARELAENPFDDDKFLAQLEEQIASAKLYRAEDLRLKALGDKGE